jgi:signal transduction histidine kinase
MGRGIGARLLVSYLLLIALAMGLLCPFLLYQFRRFYLEWNTSSLQARALAISDTVDDRLAHPGGHEELEQVTRLFRRQDRVIVRILDARARVLASTDPADHKGDSMLAWDGVRRGLAGQINSGRAYTGRPATERLYVIVPVRQENRTLGLVRVSLRLEDFNAAYRRMESVFLGALAITFLACSATSLLLSRGLGLPIRHMSGMAMRIGAGHLHERVAIRGPRELQQLGAALNAMADRLAEQERIRRDFLQNASHELRTPLSNLRVALETLIETPPVQAGMAQRMLHGALGEIDRLSLLVRDLLDLARIQSEAGIAADSREEYREFSCRALLHPLVAAVAPRLQARRLELEVTVPPDVRVVGDEPRLAQALMNLLDNAIRCSPEGSRLRLSARRRGDFVEIALADSGPGIPAADLPYIFDRFYTVNKARSRESSGTGLGLAITRSILERHGGTVEAVGRPEGGTTFVLRLPRPAATSG